MLEQLITYRGRSNVNKRTWTAIEAAEAICGFKFVITQGSYNTSVAASGGTHAGGGVVDIRTRDLSDANKIKVRNALRMVGFCAWLRTPDQANWPYHCHAVLKGDKDLSRQAAAQVVDYMEGRNGLASKGKDDGPRDWVNVTLEGYLAARKAIQDALLKGDTRPRNSK